MRPVHEPNRPHTCHALLSLLSVPEAAKILGVSQWTLRQWLCQRRLPVVKVGRLTKLRLQDLERFIEAHVEPAREVRS
jgi:excisionase family DNA binding protein